jgi:Entner-Doudoroff aldolase
MHCKASAIIRSSDRSLAADAMDAAIRGGFKVVEFTLNTPGALDLIERFSGGDVMVGAGTVMTDAEAKAAVNAGAEFLVSPVCDTQVIQTAHALEVPCIPGTMTPNEMVAAHRAGADLVKLFPAPYDVVEYVGAVLGPLPHLRIYPTAGVTLDNCVEVLRAGAAGCGFVRSLFTPAHLRAGDFAAIEHRARRIIRRLTEAGCIDAP